MREAAGSVDTPIVDRIIQLCRGLRARGFDISLAETIDATDATRAVGVADRVRLREALRATLVKTADERHDFDDLFDRAFPRRAGSGATGRRDVSTPDGLSAAIVDGDDLADVAAMLVDAHGGLDGDARGERHHVQRVLRAADLARLLGLALGEDPAISPHDLRARLEELKRLIAAEVRQRLDSPDDDPLADLENVEFRNASRVELERMRRIVQPLARRIARRLASRRRHSHAGRVDMRHTMRRSLATGGVPFDVAHRRRRPHRPQLFVLSDISGSVAEFSLFTLTLVAALSAELPRTRSFVFVDAIDEITELLERTGHEIEPWQLMRNTNVIGATGHSDYGTVLAQFWSEVGEHDLSPASTVLVTGDARSNHLPPGGDHLARIARRARAVYWLNPEPTAEWDEHDSEMSTYEAHCARVFEVRDLRQLTHSVEQIL